MPMNTINIITPACPVVLLGNIDGGDVPENWQWRQFQNVCIYERKFVLVSHALLRRFLALFTLTSTYAKLVNLQTFSPKNLAYLATLLSEKMLQKRVPNMRAEDDLQILVVAIFGDVLLIAQIPPRHVVKH